MQSLARRQRDCSRFFFNEFKRRTRTLSSSSSSSFLSNHSLTDDPDSYVLVEGNAGSRTVVLNRPSFLNALNTSMGNRLHKLYKSWEDNRDIGFVVMKGSGRSFCAGGDIVSLHDMAKKGSIEGCKEFFWTLYNFMYHVGTYLKPHVAVLDGITMGGGAGISIPGTFRVATDKTNLPAIEECLGTLKTDDPSVIETSLQKYSGLDHPDNASVIRRIETLDKCFSHDTVEEIIDALESEAAKTNDGWCQSTLKKLELASPLSLKVALRSIREGRFQTLDQCLIREYRMSLQAVSGQISGDFCEGVRSRVLDKDFAPKWDPPSLEHVSQDMVDRYFSPLTALEPELDLPTKQREAFT